jgi:RimJ/RimL family protein N-acetyltransferase
VAGDPIPRRLVPEGFDVPQRIEHERFTLRMLSVTDVVKDFAAINQRVLRDGTPEPWSDTTFLQNLADLGWHETEFRIGRSFAYTVVRPDESEVIGCVYLYPPRADDHDVEVRLWVTRAAWEEGLDAELERAVREWLARDWPFERPDWGDRATGS